MNILVTGGAGFIGSHIVNYYLSKGHTVVVVDNLTTGSLANIEPFKTNSAFKFIKDDILTWRDLDKYVEDAEIVFHMAAVIGVYRVLKEPTEVLRTNITGTERILTSIAKSHKKPRTLIASSSSVYGPSPKESLSETDPLIVAPDTHPLWGYAVSKIADESLASAFCKMHKLPITPIRFFNTVGPRQTGLYGMVVPRFVKQAVTGEKITVYGDGTQTRSFCDIRDSVEMLHQLAEKNLCIGEPINIGRDVEISINDLAQLVLKLSGSKSEITHIPYKEAYGVDFQDIQQRRPNISKMKKLLHFDHQWTLEKTINDLINSYKK